MASASKTSGESHTSGLALDETQLVNTLPAYALVSSLFVKNFSWFVCDVAPVYGPFVDYREFGDVLDAVRGPKGRVVAVTSPERAAAINAEQAGYFDKITRVL